MVLELFFLLSLVQAIDNDLPQFETMSPNGYCRQIGGEEMLSSHADYPWTTERHCMSSEGSLYEADVHDAIKRCQQLCLEIDDCQGLAYATNEQLTKNKDGGTSSFGEQCVSKRKGRCVLYKSTTARVGTTYQAENAKTYYGCYARQRGEDFGYAYLSNTCVPTKAQIENIGKKTLKNCAKNCTKRDNCLSFELGVDYGHTRSKIGTGECALMRTSDPKGCNGNDSNTDLYIKITAEPTAPPTFGIDCPDGWGQEDDMLYVGNPLLCTATIDPASAIGNAELQCLLDPTCAGFTVSPLETCQIQQDLLGLGIPTPGMSFCKKPKQPTPSPTNTPTYDCFGIMDEKECREMNPVCGWRSRSCRNVDMSPKFCWELNKWQCKYSGDVNRSLMVAPIDGTLWNGVYCTWYKWHDADGNRLKQCRPSQPWKCKDMPFADNKEVCELSGCKAKMQKSGRHICRGLFRLPAYP